MDFKQEIKDHVHLIDYCRGKEALAYLDIEECGE